MAEHKYRKVGPSNVREICVACGERPQKSIGNGKYHNRCGWCVKNSTPATIAGNKRRFKERRKKKRLEGRKDHCERCGFIPENMVQLDLDHIDGDHNNNDPLNHQTLCANCHRLKTYENGEWAIAYRPT